MYPVCTFQSNREVVFVYINNYCTFRETVSLFSCNYNFHTFFCIFKFHIVSSCS